ncbi:MAG: hypothetical protein KBA53_13945 [Thermoclostridium sp.]|nr:hypothetical protein [Thermoclostridium sp.]
MQKDTFSLFVPGRLCLFGEHSDWAGAQRVYNSSIVPGEAVVTGIEQGIYATIHKHERFIVSSSIQGEENISLDCPMSVQTLKKTAQEGEWFSYVAGVASFIKENYQVGGLEINLTARTLPVKRGLSSSAAICVLVTKAFNRMYDLRMSIKGEMQAAYFGEQRTPSRCGRLDQACAFGIQPVHMEFNGNEIEARSLTPKIELFYVFADLMTEKDTIKILADLNRSFPFPQTELDRTLQEALGQDNHYFVSLACRLIERGDAPALGALMTEAQELFDRKVAPACPSELSAPVLHHVLTDARIKELTYGGKGVGSQGDGSVQFLAKSEESQQLLLKYLSEQLNMDAFSLTLRPQYSIKRAIIPVAGFGTRLFPATHFIRKEFFPVIDQNGMTKPVILILLEELARAGIEKICLVVDCEEDRERYEELFKKELPDELFIKLPDKMREYFQSIHQIGEKLEFVVQKEKKGFGHAVYQCKQFTEDMPVLLLLGDTIYRSNSKISCTEQLMKAFEQTKITTVSIGSVPLENVTQYGILAGEWTDDNHRFMMVREITEKPTAEYAKEFLSVSNDKEVQEYFSVFGEYILTPEVFDVLENHINLNKLSMGEIQLTDALEGVRKTQGIYGFAVDGKMFDIGLPQSYLETMKGFYLS